VERSDALAALPLAYRAALELRDAGAALADIAADLGIELAALDALLAIGEQKLARLLGGGGDL
jgi:DNA-directed RNA polymerase specialized sigma24 family protein